MHLNEALLTTKKAIIKANRKKKQKQKTPTEF